MTAIHLVNDRTSAPLAATLITAFGLLSAGCGYPEVVVWFPDSNRMLYTDQEGSRIIEYDIDQRSARVIASNKEIDSPWPGLRADGQRVAVAKVRSTFEKGSDQSTVRTQVLVYDLQGTLLQESSVHVTTAPLQEPSPESRTETSTAALNWSGPDSKILLQDAIWDCSTDAWIELQTLPFPLDNAPVSPDRRGFMALEAEGEGEGESLCFVDWNGRISRFEQSFLEELNDEAGEIVSGEWDGDLYRLVFENVLLEFDTRTMQARKIDQSVEFLPSAGKLMYLCRFADGDARLCLFLTKDNQDPESGPKEYVLEWQSPARRIRKTVMTYEDHGYPSGMLSFFPSPDRTKVAVETTSVEDDSRRIVVVDATGEKVVELTPE